MTCGIRVSFLGVIQYIWGLHSGGDCTTANILKSTAIFAVRANRLVCGLYLNFLPRKFLPVIISQHTHSLQAYLMRVSEFLTDTALAKQVLKLLYVNLNLISIILQTKFPANFKFSKEK